MLHDVKKTKIMSLKSIIGTLVISVYERMEYLKTTFWYTMYEIPFSLVVLRPPSNYWAKYFYAVSHYDTRIEQIIEKIHILMALWPKYILTCEPIYWE